jgi:cation diffusion facilitator CzcD-associated flavoprotein CzcO
MSRRRAGPADGGAVREVRVAVIGGGFSGIGAVAQLKAAGIDDVVAFEQAAAVGGTWRDNTYPGCACDVPSALYSFSFAPKPDWSRFYATQPEIERYLLDVARDTGALAHVRCGVRVTGASWDEADGRWAIETPDGPWRAQVLISGTGPWHQPLIPELPGLDGFDGPVFHSSRWDHDAPLDGARVAVVGTGASAVQFVPRIQPRVARLHLFQRTPHWVLPKPDRPLLRAEQTLLRRVPGAQRALRELLRYGFEGVGMGMRHPRAMRQLQRVGELHLRRTVADPRLRAQLTPAFTLGCKRILMSNDWYPALTRDNVELIPAAVTEVRERSVVGADGRERAVDAIVFGTGFRILDQPIAALVRGRDGRTLAEHWQGSPRGYKGTTVAGFPNLFVLLGPNLGNGHSSATVLIEQQMAYVLDALRTMESRGLRDVEVRAEVQARWNARVDAALAGSVWNAGGCASYYLDENGRNSFMYPWSTVRHRRETRRFDLGAYAAKAAA